MRWVVWPYFECHCGKNGLNGPVADLYQHWSTGRLREHPYISLVAHLHPKLANKIPGRKIFPIFCFISNARFVQYPTINLYPYLAKYREGSDQWPLIIPKLSKYLFILLPHNILRSGPANLVLGRFCRCRSCTFEEHWPRLGLDLSRQNRNVKLETWVEQPGLQQQIISWIKSAFTWGARLQS